MARMVDVARLAGVSVSTVSHVLNGTRHVEPDTRERVERAIEESGYRQDALARALRRSRTESIGLVISDAGEPAFADMVHGVQEAAAAEGLTLLLAASDESRERELAAVHALLSRRVDGMIIARVAGTSDAVLDELLDSGTPFVLMDRVGVADVDQVAADNERAMRELVSDLIARGHRRVLLVAGDTRVPALRERLVGFRAAIADAGLAVDEQIVVEGERGADTVPMAITAALRADRPTAVVACSTILAAQALAALADLGLAVPGDVAVAVFDGFAYPDLFEPKLTTVRQPAFEVGATAVRLLLERIAGSPAAPRTVRIPSVVEHRASTTAGPLDVGAAERPR